MTLDEIIEKLQKAKDDGIDGSLPVKQLYCGPEPKNFVVEVRKGVIFITRRGFPLSDIAERKRLEIPKGR